MQNPDIERVETEVEAGAIAATVESVNGDGNADVSLTQETQTARRGTKNENNGDPNASADGVQIHSPKRKIVVEPIVVIMTITLYPLSLISTLYSYEWFKEDVARRTGFDLNRLEKSNATPCDEIEANKSGKQFKFIEEVADAESFYKNITMLAQTVPLVASTIFLSAYSDRAGRKWALLPSMVFKLIASVLQVLIVHFKLNVWILLASSFVASLGGAPITGIYAYVSDQTLPRDRRFRITVIELCENIGSILGPIGFGYWIKKSGYFYPSLITVSGHVLNILYTVFFVPETVKNAAKGINVVSVGTLKKSSRLFTEENGTGRRWKFLCIYTALMITFLVATDDIISRVELNPPLCWDSVTIGYFRTVKVGVATVGGVGVAWLFGRCMTDSTVAVVTGIACIVEAFYKGFTVNSTMMFISPALSPFATLFKPTLRTLLSRLVEQDQQGTLQGTIYCGEILLKLLGGFLFNIIYSKTIWITPAFVYFTIALGFLCASSLISFYIVKMKREKRNESYSRLSEDEPP